MTKAPLLRFSHKQDWCNGVWFPPYPNFKTQFMKTVYPDQPITDFNSWINFIHSLINSHGKSI